MGKEHDEPASLYAESRRQPCAELEIREMKREEGKEEVRGRREAEVQIWTGCEVGEKRSQQRVCQEAGH